MRVLLIMDPGILVPPENYGGHERLVYMFAREYARLGHDVHLLVTNGSHVEGCTVHGLGKPGLPKKRSEVISSLLKAWKFLWKYHNDFDLIHNFGRLAYLVPVLRNSVKKVMTYGREISSRNIRIINKLKPINLVYTGCSNNLISRVNAGGRWEAVYNAIDFKKYSIQPSLPSDAPLIFLGRLEQVKGVHTAIKIAKATNDSLIIAGNISSLPEERLYFENQIKPHIDMKQIFYVGALDDDQKNQYLGKAKALLFPIEWNEPFGMVMVEAMACGTPVIAYKMGSVPEVVTENVTGSVVTNEDEMIQAVRNITSINRTKCRSVAESNFDVQVIAAKYLSL
jgi:glycosyltransferase involved in cell wall biosynthesis